jgi:hypothetical protein
MVRVLAIFIPIFILVGFLKGAFSSELLADEPNTKALETSIDSVGAMVLSAVFYYVYLARKIRAVSS